MIKLRSSDYSISKYAFFLCFFLFCVGGMLAQLGAATAQELEEPHRAEISETNRMIQETGGRWVAGETFFTGLSLEEKRKWLGLKMPEIAERVQFSKEDIILPQETLVAFPPSLDWRNNKGNFVTPVRNQRSCGSCWAFATTGAMESYTLIRDNSPGTDLDLSEQVLVSCGGNCNRNSPCT